MSQAAVDDLIHPLDLELIEVNIFRGSSPKEDIQRVFGGLLYTQDTPAATNGRGLTCGLVFTEEGRLVASVVQEGVIRVVPS